MAPPTENLKPAPTSNDSLEALGRSIVERPDDSFGRLDVLIAGVIERYYQDRSPEVLADDLVSNYLRGLPASVQPVLHAYVVQRAEAIRRGKTAVTTADERPATFIGDPVEHYRGELVHEATDLVVRGAGIDFAFHRTYRHQTIGDGPLGHRWDHGYNMFLQVNELQGVLSMGGGRNEVYRRHTRYGAAGFDYYVPPDGLDATLEPLGLPSAPTGWVRRSADGLRHVFEPEPGWSGAFRLARIEDRWGNYLGFTYTIGPSGIARLDRCSVNSEARWVRFAHDQHDRIVRVTDHTDRAWQYHYDAHGDLVRVTTPAAPRPATTEYRYTSRDHTGPLAHLLTDIFDAAGRHYLHTEYGLDRGSIEFNRVVRQRLGTGDFWFRYEAVDAVDEGLAVADRPSMRCWVKERNGHQTLYVYNAWGALLWKQELDKGPGHAPRTVVWRYRYNRDGALTASRTPEGVVRHVLTGRDHYYRVHGAALAEEPWLDENLTAEARRGFGRVLATVDRAARHTVATLGWADRWGDVYAVDADDLVVKHTYEPAYGQPLTISDPRTTAASDPRFGEDSEYARLLTRFEYEGPTDDPTRDLVRVIQPTPTLPDGSVGGPVVTEILARDPRGRVVQARDAVGVVTATEHVDSGPAEGFVASTTLDPGDRAAGYLAITTRHAVDALGRVTETTLPRGVDAGGGFVVATEYDALDRVTEARRATPLATATRTTYEPAGKPAQIETDWPTAADPGGKVVRRFAYDEEHRVVKETFGGSALGAHRRIAHRYGANGLVAVTVRPNDHNTQWRYDSRDLLARTIHGAGVGEGIEELVRDRDGRVIEHRSPEGRTTRTEYDGFGRVAAVIDALGNQTRTSYDRAGRPTVVRVFERRTLPLPVGDVYVLLARTETVYDELGRPARSFVARFDTPPPPVSAGDLPTAFVAGPGPGVALETRTFFDPAGRPVRVVDPMGNERTTEYDAAGRVVRVTDPTGNQVKTTYDSHGNAVRVDRHDLVRDLDGAVIGEEVITSFAEYDARDRVIATTDPLGNVTTHAYDSLDRLIATTDPLGNVVEREYDVYGDLVAVRELRTDTGDGTGAPLPPHVVRYEHDGAGLVTARIDALGRRTEQRYDKRDRVIEKIFPDGARVVTRYDRDSLPIAVRDAHGVILRTAFDPLGRPEQTRVDTAEVDGGVTIEGARQIDRTFDALGRLVLAADETCTIATRYDSLGRAIAESTEVIGEPARELARIFDDAGRLVGLTYPGGRTLAHDRDEAGRLLAVRHTADGADYPGKADNARTVIRYAHAGDRVRAIARANATTTVLAHDAAGRVLGLRHATPADTTLLTTQLFRDGARAPRLRVEKGPWTGGERLGYDARYQLTGRASDSALTPIDPTPFAPPASAPIGVPPPRQPAIDALIGARIAPDSSATDTAWRYDLVGNRTQTRSPAGDHEYEVTDPRDRYLRIDGTAREYDRAGSLTFDERREYVYDGFRRLVRVRDRATGVDLARYTYDPLGRRVVEEHDLEQPTADRIVIVHDGSDRIADYRDGRCFAQYAHGPGVDDPIELAATATEHYYHADLQGSVRALTTREGDAAASYRFDPFGVLVESSGPPLGLADVEAAQPFGFAGRPFDPSLGLYDLRARAYDPALGRFLQRDPAGPVDGHLYTYAGNHPLAFGDPAGLARRERFAIVEGVRFPDHDGNHLVDLRETQEGYDALDPAQKTLMLKRFAGAALPMPVFSLEAQRWMAHALDHDYRGSFDRHRADQLATGPMGNGTMRVLEVRENTASFMTNMEAYNSGIFGALGARLGQPELGLALQGFSMAVGMTLAAGARRSPAPRRGPPRTAPSKNTTGVATRRGAVLFHGTDVASARELSNGAPLDPVRAATSKIDGPRGFFLATHAEDAEYFALRRQPGAVLRYSFSEPAVVRLGLEPTSLGALGKFGRFLGSEVRISVEQFEEFNQLRAAGEITVTPHNSQ